MISIKTFFLIYLFGGITFIPICVFIVFYLLSKPVSDVDEKENDKLLVDVDPDFKVGDFNELKGVAAKKEGWIHMTRQFYPHQSDVDNQNQVDGSDETDSSINLTSSEQQITRDKLKKKDKFYAVLKHGNLFLYKDNSPGAGPQQVIVLNDAFISIWPRTISPQDNTPISDGSLFTKKTCISIWKKHTAYLSESGEVQFRKGGPSDQFFIYLDLNTDKEDWYFALIQATKLSNSSFGTSTSTTNLEVDKALSAEYFAQTAHFKTKDMLQLIQTLNSTEGQHSSQWFNALLGRLFLSFQHTETLSNALKERIYKKLRKINKPGLLDDFSIETVDVGNGAPLITNAKLLDLTPEGLTRVSFDLLYTGHLHLIIATKVNINLGSRFKKREMDIKLSITAKKVEGPVVILVKPPPSNRLWYAFQSEPLLDIDVEPVLSTRQLSNNMVTNMIKSKFKEAIKESIVLPYMDDMVYYTTTSEIYRGGIWKRPETETDTKENINLEELKTQTAHSSGFSVKEENDYSKNVEQQDEKPQNNFVPSSPTTDNNETSFTNIIEPEIPRRSGENLKAFLKNRSNDDSNLSLRSKSSSDSINSTTTKRYLQTGMKKIGRWYKDQVTTVKESLNDDSKGYSDRGDLRALDFKQEVVEETSFIEKDVKVQESTNNHLELDTGLRVESNHKTTGKPSSPEMISSRRMPRSKTSSIDSTKAENYTKQHNELHKGDMFVNRSRARSTSGSFGPTSPIPDSFRRREDSFSFSNNENLNPQTATPHNIPEEVNIVFTPASPKKKNKRPPPPPLLSS